MNKRKILSKALSFVTALALAGSLSTSVVHADTSSSPGGFSGDAGGTHGDFWGVGQGYSAGNYWSSFEGDADLYSELPDLDRMGVSNSLSIEAKKGAYVTIDNRLNGRTTWLRWPWWFYFLKASPGELGNSWNYDPWDTNGYFGQSGLSGQLPDPELVEEANKHGYSYDSSSTLYSNGSDYLDAVWVSGWTESRSAPATTIVWAEADDETILEDRSYESAESLYEYPTTSLEYTGKSKPNEFNHKRVIKAKFMYVRKNITYKTDGKKRWDIEISYSKMGSWRDEKTILYHVKQPRIYQTFFRPYDLNRNGLADENEVRQSYSEYQAGGQPLELSVDNMQDITDGTKLKTLDSNTSTPFEIKINNNQLGIPTASSGGFDLDDGAPGSRNGDGTYDPSIMNEIGTNGEERTGVIRSSTGFKQDVPGTISKDKYWQGSLKGTISADTASLTFDGNERIGGDLFIFSKNWLGGKFNFKTTKIGDYNLYNGRNWWEIDYEQGKFYSYGVQYRGTITVGEIGEPNVVDKGFYVNLASRNMVQPVLKGVIEAKTVGGNIG